MPKSRGVPKVVCLRVCVPKEQQGVKIRTFQPSHRTFFEGLPKNPKNFAKKLYVVGVPEYAEIFHLIYYGSALKTPAKKVRSFVRPIIINVRYSPRPMRPQ